MLKKILSATLLASIATGASAHEIWLERHGDTARVYVGDVTGERDAGEQIAKLVPNSKLFQGAGDTIGVTAQPDHLLAQVSAKGDLRYYNDQVWAPWAMKEGGYQAAAFQAKAGRNDTNAVHMFELVPVARGSNAFTLMFQGKPLADTSVTVINPELWEKSFKTDAAGRLTVPARARGRYVLVARHTAPTDVQINGVKIDSLQHIASLSFVVDR